MNEQQVIRDKETYADCGCAMNREAAVRSGVGTFYHPQWIDCIAALRAEVARLTADNERLIEDREEAFDRAEAAKAEVAALREQLAQYDLGEWDDDRLKEWLPAAAEMELIERLEARSEGWMNDAYAAQNRVVELEEQLAGQQMAAVLPTPAVDGVMTEVVEGVMLPLTDRTIDLIVDAMSAEQMAAVLKVVLKERRDMEAQLPDVTVTAREAPLPGERENLVIRAERGPLDDRWVATDAAAEPEAR